MADDSEKMTREILDLFKKIDYIRPAEVPDIQLYMDQVTTFMDEHLKTCKRYDEDKILTKTMINNYAKNNVIPAPVKKKYSREHMLLLIFVYYFKSFLSIGDIATLLHPLEEKYFGTQGGLGLDEIYRKIYDMEKSQLDYIEKDIAGRVDIALKQFSAGNKKDEEYLHTFALVCLLSFDVYVKKQLIEQLIDKMPDPVQKKKEEKPKRPKK